MDEQENEYNTADPEAGPEPAPSGVNEEAPEEPMYQEEVVDQEDAGKTEQGVFQRMRAGRFFGSFVYVYFALFVIFHIVVVLIFLMVSIGAVTGFVLWIIMMILGGLSIVALSVWRDQLHTFWDR